MFNKTDDYDIHELMGAGQVFAYFGSRAQSELNSTLVTDLPYNCVATTLTNTKIAHRFNIEQRRFAHTVDRAKDIVIGKMNRRDLLILYLNGFDTEFTSMAKKRQQIREREAMLEQMAVASVINFGRMVFLGYDPQSDAEVSPERLVMILEGCKVRYPVFFDIDEAQVKADEYLQVMRDDLKATFMASSCADLLEEQVDWESDTDYERVVPSASLYVAGLRCDAGANQDAMQQAAGLAEVLTVETMEREDSPAFLRQERFRAFLAQSFAMPKWYGYRVEDSLYVQRHYHQVLLHKVIDSLKMVDGADSRKPVVLCGQTCTSKSIELMAIASDIFYEKQFPVVRILAPDCNFGLDSGHKGNENFDVLNHLLYHLEELVNSKGQQAKSILVIWDCNEWKASQAIRLQKALNFSSGRQVVVLFTSLNEGNIPLYERQDVRVVQAHVQLDDKEVNVLGELLKHNTNLSEASIHYWLKRNPKHNLLNYLYYLVDDLHPQLADGLNEELQKSSEEVKRMAQSLPLEFVGNENEDFPWQIALKHWKDANLAEAGIPGDFPDVRDEDYQERLREFIQCLALLSSAPTGPIAMPQSLAISLLGAPNTDQGRAWIRRVFDLPWLQYRYANDDQDAIDYSLEFRTPLEARIWLDGGGTSHGLATENRVLMLELMLRKLVDEQTYSQQACLEAMEKLIRAIGPNGPAKEVYQSFWERIADAVHHLWEQGIQDEKLATQEVVYRREAANKEKDNDRKIDMLRKAYQTAIEARTELVRRAGGDDISIGGALLVESIFCWDRYIGCYQADDLVRLPTFGYLVNFQSLQKIIEQGKANSYHYHALCRLFLRMKDDKEEDEISKLQQLGLVVEMLDRATGDVYTALTADIQTETFETDKLEIYKCLNNNQLLQNYQKELLARGSAMGIYLEAKQTLLQAGMQSYRVSLISHSEWYKACCKALQLLESDNSEIQQAVAKSTGCQFMRLNLFWLVKNGDPIFPAREDAPVCTYMSKKIWKKLRNMAELYLETSFSRQRGGWYEIVMRYIAILSCAQLYDYLAANEHYKALRQQVSGVGIAYHLLCDEDGPRLFQAHFDRKDYQPERSRTGFAKVEGVHSSKNRNGKIYYRLSNVAMNAINDDVKDDVQVALNFVDWTLYRNRKGDR